MKEHIYASTEVKKRNEYKPKRGISRSKAKVKVKLKSSQIAKV